MWLLILSVLLVLWHPASGDDPAGTVCSIAHVGGVPTVALHGPWGIAMDPSGSFALVTEQDAHRIRVITAPLGAAVVSTLAGSDASPGLPGYVDDTGTSARFDTPRGIAMDAAGTFALVADSNNALIRRVDMVTGAVTTVAGSPWVFGLVDGVGAAALFRRAAGIAVDAAGSIAVVVSVG